MVVFSETFNQTDVDDVVYGDTTSIGAVLDWTCTVTNTNVHSGALAVGASAGSYSESGASTEVLVGTHNATATVAAFPPVVDDGDFYRLRIQLGAGIADGDAEGAWRLDVGKVKNGFLPEPQTFYEVMLTLDNGFITQFTLDTVQPGPTFSDGDTFSLITSGRGTTTTFTVKHNGTTLATYGSAEFIGAGCTTQQLTDDLPEGEWDQVYMYVEQADLNTENTLRVGAFTDTVLQFAEAGTFTPPVNPDEVPPTLPHDQYSLSYKLFRHYRSRPCGRNVYIYSDDSVSENDPDGYSTLWKESDRTSSTNPTAPHVVRAFWGAHDAEDVTAEEAALLINAGYTVD